MGKPRLVASLTRYVKQSCSEQLNIGETWSFDLGKKQTRSRKLARSCKACQKAALWVLKNQGNVMFYSYLTAHLKAALNIWSYPPPCVFTFKIGIFYELKILEKYWSYQPPRPTRLLTLTRINRISLGGESADPPTPTLSVPHTLLLGVFLLSR